MLPPMRFSTLKNIYEIGMEAAGLMSVLKSEFFSGTP